MRPDEGVGLQVPPSYLIQGGFPVTDITTFSTAFVATVAVVSLVLTVLTVVAARRTGHRRVYFVAGALGMLFLKSAIAAFGLATASIPHEHLEVVQGAFDLAMVALLAAPFLLRA